MHVALDPPRLHDLPRVDGVLRQSPEDFVVEEIPAYAPSGEGSHCFLHIQKTGMTTQDAIRRIAEALGVDRRAAGSAGLKDRHAVTTQWLSFEGIRPEDALALELADLKVLEAVPHEKKLKTGHLRGNRFVLQVREVPEDQRAPIVAAAQKLDRVPNYFGEQRFGRDGLNIPDAKRWLAEGGRSPRDRFRKRFLVSAWQSAGFNALAARRVADGTLDQVLEGDLLMTDRGGTFVADELVSCQARADLGEVDPTGPMFGRDMRWPEGPAKALEEEVFEAEGFTVEALARMGKLGLGTRRALRLWPRDLTAEVTEGGFRIAFELPSGAYATVVLRELLRAAPE